MEWWLAILGFIMSLLATADLAYKYGPTLFKFFRRSNPLSNERGTSLAIPRIALELAASPELQALLIKKTSQINKSILKKTY